MLYTKTRGNVNHEASMIAASVSACLLALSSSSLPSAEAAGNLSYPATTWDLGDREE